MKLKLRLIWNIVRGRPVMYGLSVRGGITIVGMPRAIVAGNRFEP